MVISQDLLKKIRKIIDKHYKSLTISMVGPDSFTKADLKALKAQGVDVSNKDSLLRVVYAHHFLNHPASQQKPLDVESAIAQQAIPEAALIGEAHDYTIATLNDRVSQNLAKMSQDVTSRIESIINHENDAFKLNSLLDVDRAISIDEALKTQSVEKVTQLLRDASGQGSRDWQRIAITECNNASGIGSVDRIVASNQGKSIDEVIVWRATVQDSTTCKYCRNFYGMGQPKIYKLSTLLANGTNYGIKADQWSPVIGSTHPNSRTGPCMELSQGWILEGRKPVWVGKEKWRDWVHDNLTE